MEELTLDMIRSWPKAELHVHLDGSLRTTTMIELATAQAKLDVLPAQTPNSLTRAVRGIDDAGSLEAYLAWFDITLALMQDYDSLVRVAYEFVQDAASENVCYVEVRFCPLLHTQEGMTLEHVLDAVLEGLGKAGAEFGVETGVIICALRGKHERESLHLAQLAVAYHGRGVVAFDLAGPEAGHPAKEHLQAFYHARNNLMSLTIHAGESWGPTSVRQALFFCGAHRLGHGIATAEDRDLQQYVVNHQIPLEVCPTSNVQTQVAKDYASHPIKALVDAGAAVSINTDSRLFSSYTLSEEILRTHLKCGLTANQVRDCVRNGFKSAFTTPARKRALLSNLEQAFSA